MTDRLAFDPDLILFDLDDTLCDSRLATMGYGKRLLRALPPMRRLHSAQEFEEAIAVLTRTATTHAPCP